MTCGAIISRARDLTDTNGAAFFPDVEAFASLNEGYRDLYEKILDSNDDYFATDWFFSFSGLTPIPNQSSGFTIALPLDFYRLRILQFQVGEAWYTIKKYAPLDEARQARDCSYRIVGDHIKLLIPSPGSMVNFRAIYYPVPTEYSDPTIDIVFPPQLEASIMAYQIAIDIKRKQSADYAQITERRNELWIRFVSATNRRDDSQYEPANNVYQASNGWFR